MAGDLLAPAAAAAVAAAFFATGTAGFPHPARAFVYAAALSVGLLLFSREILGGRAGLAAALLLLAAAGALSPGSLELRRSTLLAGSLLFLLAADRSPRTLPNPGLLLGGWLFLGASLLPGGVAPALVVPLALAGHLALRPAGTRLRFLRTPAHALGIAAGGAALWVFVGMARSGEVHWLLPARGASVPPTIAPGGLPAALLPLLPPAAAAVVWAWRRARRDEVPFARTGLAWLGAAAVVEAYGRWEGSRSSGILAMVPLALLTAAWLEEAAERNPLGNPARWAVGSACALAAAVGVMHLLHRDRAALDAGMTGMMEVFDPTRPPWAWIAAGALLLLGAAAAAVRMFLLAAPTRAVIDLVLALAAAGLVLGIGVRG
jgi:hypothetical protein